MAMEIYWRPEIATESEILTEGESLWSKKCKKNPGHKGFIPYDRIKITDLPEGYQNEETLERVQNLGKFVVRLKVKTEKGKEKLGTGFVTKICGQFYIETNNHVVETKYEAEHCTVQFNYDGPEATVIECKGQGDSFYTNDVMDDTTFGFSPVPQFVQDMNVPEYGANSMYVDISNEMHRSTVLIFPIDGIPHGHIAFNPNLFDSSQIQIKVRDYEISQLASFYLRIDSTEECWNPEETITISFQDRTLTGKILLRDNRILVKVEEPLTEVEAQGCSIRHPNGTTCNVTGIYFIDTIPKDEFLSKYDTFGSRRFFSSFDGPEIFVVPFKPVPNFLTDLHKEFTVGDMMMVIGHPHGSHKMVSFGQMLEVKAVENEKKKKMVECNIYNCPTCPGNSGSPVLPLKMTFPHSGTTPHFQGDEKSNRNMSSFF